MNEQSPPALEGKKQEPSVSSLDPDMTSAGYPRTLYSVLDFLDFDFPVLILKNNGKNFSPILIHGQTTQSWTAALYFDSPDPVSFPREGVH